MMLYNANGEKIDIGTSEVKQAKYGFIKGIAHRGYSGEAPENTLPAYILARKLGYDYTECDVAFTSDGVAVLLHDATIDRTSNGSGSIASMTYEQALAYDFGSWKSAEYAGTKIPTFEEFIILCKNIGLHPYIEIKSDTTYTRDQIVSIVDAVNNAGMRGNVSYVSFSTTYLTYIKEADPYARLGHCSYDITSGLITSATGLKTDHNEVFVSVRYQNCTDAKIALASAANIPVGAWTVNDEATALGLHSYVSEITTDSLNAEEVLYKHYMGE